MGYMKINNLYKDTRILDFKEGYALEKIHGTSAHISWKDNEIIYFAGGEKYINFKALFLEEDLITTFKELFPDMDVTLFGEAYGGKQQGMSNTYGKDLMFIVFDVKIGETWLNVPNAEGVTKKLNLDFVDYVKISTDLDIINRERDKPSTQAIRNCLFEDKLREGVVLRPLEEMKDSRGNRVMCKHKNDEFMETKTPRKVDAGKLKLLKDAESIAEEWVTPMRLSHVLDKLNNPSDIKEISSVIKATVQDVLLESEGEIVVTTESKKAIAKKAAQLYKLRISKI